MDKKQPEKRNCPFCGCNQLDIIKNVKRSYELCGKISGTLQINNQEQKGYRVECTNCGTNGPIGMISKKDAMLVWNNGEYPKGNKR